jgi:hypothetical protein
MALPELQTGGVDLTNTLMKINSMKHMDLQNQNIQSQMETRELSKVTQNALRKAIQMKDEEEIANKKLDREKKTADLMREGLAWTLPQVETTGSAAPYDSYRQHMVQHDANLAKLIPDSNIFYDEKPDINADGGKTQIFNKDRFKTWATGSMAKAADVSKAGLKALKDKYTPTTVYLKNGDTVMHMLDKHSKEPFKPAEIYGAGATVEKPSYESDKGTWSEPYKGPDGTLLKKNLKTNEVKAVIGRKPEKTESKAKITGNVGINPETNSEEYLMTDGSFSGTKPGAKPASKKAKGGLARLEDKNDKKVDDAQERKWAAEALAKNPEKADKIKANFKTRTGKDY